MNVRHILVLTDSNFAKFEVEEECCFLLGASFTALTMLVSFQIPESLLSNIPEFEVTLTVLHKELRKEYHIGQVSLSRKHILATTHFQQFILPKPASHLDLASDFFISSDFEWNSTSRRFYQYLQTS